MSSNGSKPMRLAALARGDVGVLVSIELPDALAERLMIMGFVPGVELRAAGAAPGGDPRVYRVDGAEIALRHDTASRLLLESSSRNGDA